MTNAKKIEDIGCLEAVESLYTWLDNELDDAELASGLEHHLSHCKSCWSRAEMEKSLTERIRKSVRAQSGGDKSGRSPGSGSLQTRLDKLLKQL